MIDRRCLRLLPEEDAILDGEDDDDDFDPFTPGDLWYRATGFWKKTGLGGSVYCPDDAPARSG